MFDLIPNLVSSVASFLFPVFASYKALKTSDPAQLTPWLMYWVVLSFVVLFESWTGWILFWVPFYAYARFLFLLYLVLPQTQGARVIYETYVHPRLEENETAIEELIATAHERLRTAGIAYLKRAIELLRTNREPGWGAYTWVVAWVGIRHSGMDQVSGGVYTVG
ncbi:hypothetical protein VTJ83DRAFT_5375 [Remersonia thermophila]|uniref:Protein YOP1 n=1 Tax=Remersonia thermophila TaxID=72144 RepID=A0ABR4D6R9_9PEZI